MTILSTNRTETSRDERSLEARRAGASRDAGLRRVSRLTGWTVAIAIGLTGVLSEVVAHALPGRSKQAAAAASRPAATRPATRSTTTAPAAPSASQQRPSNPQPPQQAPAQSTASGGAVSGGS
jgi:hypothetical protein